jgi:serine/threonine protein kinase
MAPEHLLCKPPDPGGKVFRRPQAYQRITVWQAGSVISPTQQWLHQRLNDPVLEFFRNEHIGVVTPLESMPPAEYQGTWHTIGCGYTANAHRGVPLDRCALSLVFCNPADTEQVEKCLKFLNSLSSDAPAMILVTHSVPPLSRTEVDEDAYTEVISKLLRAGIDDVIMGEPVGIALIRAVQSKTAVGVKGVQKQDEVLNEHRQELLVVESLEENIQEGLWNSLRQRLKLKLPPLDYRHESEEPKQIGEFSVGALLGEGAFAKVFKLDPVTPHQTCSHQVLKMIPKTSVRKANQLLALDKHIKIMMMLSETQSHPGIVKLYQVYHTMNHVSFRMECGGSKNLFKHLSQREKCGTIMPAAKVKSLITQVIEAMAFLHQVPRVAHRDIKPENIILSEDAEQVTVKLADFDLAMFASENTTVTDCAGTFPFLAPELVLERKPRVLPTDVWSMGIVSLEVLCRCWCVERSVGIHSPPRMKSTDMRQLLGSVQSRFHQPQAVANLLKSEIRPELEEMMGASLVLLEGMLEVDPQKRWAVSELLEALPLLVEGVSCSLVGSVGPLRKTRSPSPGFAEAEYVRLP